MKISSEMRETARIPIVNAVDVNFNGHETFLALAVNISLNGVFLRGTGLLPVEGPCQVAISLPLGPQGGRFLAEGWVVRSGEEGTAIRFAQALGRETLNFITGSGREASLVLDGSLLGDYLNYFHVTRSRNERDCQVAFGISCKVFTWVTTASFLACVLVALLPVLIFHAQFQLAPAWVKLLSGFSYGVAWLMVLQPLADLTVFRLLRGLKARSGRRRRSPS